MAGKIRRVFPGGNTSKGFYSYYDNIIEKDANRIFILKGGPGTGKSSLMKKIAKDMLERGYDVEYHHCSSDNNSIDAIVMPKLRVAMIDGTAPHVVDPKNPGAVDEIIHLGDFWDTKGMEENKDKILYYIENNSKFYKRAYKYFPAARLIQEDIMWMNGEAQDFAKVNIETSNLIKDIFGELDISEKLGKVRYLFGSAYTPNGWVEYTDTLLEESEVVYYIKGDFGTGKSTLLEKIYKEAVIRGLDVEVHHTPLIPEKIETVIIKELSLALSTSKKAEKDNYKTIDLDKYLNNQILEKYRINIEQDKEIYRNLIEIAISNIAAAKKNHDIIETYYVPNMNFSEIEKIRHRLIDRILQYEK